ncbi:MAG: type II toxin-antitoxin system PemK/MazF family toxin [Cytophagales bacterium]|nr:type II toxin-antitoxin system PemK/MazF family toxin [Cytophagales bacterium]
MKKVPGINYKQKEIVLVPFPYSDLSATKKRPVLIISNNDYNKNFEDVIVCVITSSQYKDSYSVALTNRDLETGTLPERSIIKTHKLFTIHQARIVKKFSLVKDELFTKVQEKIKRLIERKKSKKKIHN